MFLLDRHARFGVKPPVGVAKPAGFEEGFPKHPHPRDEFGFDYAFPQEGPYIVRIASAEHGVGFDDLPPFKVKVLPPRVAENEAGPREAPGWGILASVACAALVTLALPRR